jgi:hypothetical protein
MESQHPPRRTPHRSRPEAALLALYAAVAVALLGSIGAGVAMSGGAETVVSAADAHQVELASR